MTELKKVVLEIKDKEIELSLGEAAELRDILTKIIGDGNSGKEKEYVSYPVYYPQYIQPYPSAPVYPNWPSYPNYWYTTCDNETSSYTITSGNTSP